MNKPIVRKPTTTAIDEIRATPWGLVWVAEVRSTLRNRFVTAAMERLVGAENLLCHTSTRGVIPDEDVQTSLVAAGWTKPTAPNGYYVFRLGKFVHYTKDDFTPQKFKAMLHDRYRHHELIERGLNQSETFNRQFALWGLQTIVDNLAEGIREVQALEVNRRIGATAPETA